MALPVAQLGYMPNLNVPSSVPTYAKNNPWEQLAMQALGAAVGQGVTNLMSSDATKVAAAEGLVDPTQVQAAPWYKRMVVGPTTSQEQLGQLRQAEAARKNTQAQLTNAQYIAQLGEEGATKRSQAEIEARKFQEGLNRDVNREQIDATNARAASQDALTRQQLTETQRHNQEAEKYDFGRLAQDAAQQPDDSMKVVNQFFPELIKSQNAQRLISGGQPLTADEIASLYLAALQKIKGQYGSPTLQAPSAPPVPLLAP